MSLITLVPKGGQSCSEPGKAPSTGGFMQLVMPRGGATWGFILEMKGHCGVMPYPSFCNRGKLGLQGGRDFCT